MYPPYAAPFAPYERAHTPEPPQEEPYAPLVDISILNPAPNDIPPIYPAYAAMFTTSEEAREHRKRIRVAPKTQLTDLERVKRYGRQYWVHKLYDAMISISNITDNASSIHRTRFTSETAFEQSDLEATAHQLFDEALAVHERGYNRPKIYHKHVVRGKLKDLGEHSIEMRLVRICHHLRINKATVDDALRGGVTLSLLCDNPDARGNTKQSNNAGNKKRAERLKREKEMKKLEEAGKAAEKVAEKET
ncbi:hypothetical protein FB567DRAFT_450203 [Paraphoma chrysanthemicola]|uniref:Uncharacterized protein n=1 Tax=Paraphoma chrysanthemicola TaxID=798071 RepID=A0A8K0QZP3_9PLEO|nr:hypothetical protein FB567DRAFT_450203 [Paraphoma chrysanthemicola]